MQFLSARSLLYIRVLLLLVISFLLITDPQSLTDANFTILLAQAMELPFAQVSDTNPLLGILSIVFGVQAISDLIPLLAENIEYFETITPTRLIFFFGLGAYTYLSSNSIIANSLVFVYAFFEIWFNFLIFNNLRDEKYYRLKKFVEEHADEIQQEAGDQVRVVEVE
ncbi:hypothetical protein HYPBUDRAFT_108344 [Hyphopichia burtonii NRRL Y-1933]|uniref:Increased loss of mitochondrial DNA protein 1 n=1 Tax=Hyphopichia burtonii NRRL Y-1933 TaxID=984485 RepID=A0A1E4RK72_9ASCO|nr:hypothetical protein HYPBUDRAFT_108344 [Hyphopichia burtonii NRRL Y-1933]ODV67677.1 hypothetical protein HYPBUDRAFT_108344 [Hyphopichia burtonii NRRL Y-1933]